MNKYSKLFSSLLVVLLMLDIATPALTYAATAELVDEEGVEEVSTSKVTEEETVTTEAVQSAEEKTEDGDQPVVDTPAVVEEQTHPTTQTDAEKLQEENEVTREAMEVAEEEVRKAQAGGNLIPVNITNTELKGNKSSYHNGDQIGIAMDWNITPGTKVQSGDYFEVSYPHFLNVANQTLQMNHGVCEPANGVMTCTFDDRVNGKDNLSGGFEFGAQLKFQENSGKHNETIYINGVAVGQVEVDAGDGSTGNTGGTTGRDFGKWGTRSMEDPSIINWTVELNGDLKYDNIYFTDTPGHGHHILPETVSVGINGQTVDYKNSQHVDSHSVTENSISMQLRTYRLDYTAQKYNATIYYSTKITDENVKGWSNSATMTPHGGQTQSTSTFVEKFGGAWSQGELAKYRGSFTVVKTDEAGTPLQGATFNLKDNEGKVVQTFTTDENGQATIADIAGGHYTLVETAAPVGYVLNEEAMDVMLKFDQEKSFTKEVVNKKAEAPTCKDFTLIVKDGNKEDSKFVEGATVTKDGVEVGQTDTNGKIVMDPLTPGQDYEFVISKGEETKTVTIKGDSDDCQFEVVLEQPAPKTCENFTVNTEDGSKVTITDKETNETFETGEVEDGKFVTEKPLEPGKDYTVTVEKDGYKKEVVEVKGSEDNCEITVDLTEKQVCSNFTVTVKDNEDRVDDATVTIVEKDNPKIVVSGQTGGKGAAGNGRPDGQFVTSPLDQGKTYIVTVEKDGYKKVEKEITVDKNCGMEINISKEENPKEEVCEDFTVVTEEGATVTITDSEGKEFAKGTVENGKFTTDKPLEVDKEYTVIVEKDGYETTEKTVTGSEDNCEVIIKLIKELGGQTPPTEPEETPGEVVTPENPDEGEGTETPELPEGPGTETPEEKPSTGGGGGSTPPTDPETPEGPTIEEPEETPGTETPETPGTETPESTEATIVLTKVDAKNENKVLEGAVFDLYKKDGNVLVTEGLVTNKEGLIKVENLEAGEYYFVERRAPKGYKLNREQHFVTAVAGKTTPITVENKKRPSGGGGGGSTTPTEPETPTTPEEGEGEETPETPEGETETPSETPGEGEETPETPEGETPEVPEGEETPEGETETPSETPEGTETEKDDNKDETPIITDRPNNDKNSTVDSDKRPTTNTDSTQKVEQEKPAVEKGNVLPQTGEATNMFVLFLAGLLIATGSVLVIRRRTA